VAQNIIRVVSRLATPKTNVQMILKQQIN